MAHNQKIFFGFYTQNISDWRTKTDYELLSNPTRPRSVMDTNLENRSAGSFPLIFSCNTCTKDVPARNRIIMPRYLRPIFTGMCLVQVQCLKYRTCRRSSALRHTSSSWLPETKLIQVQGYIKTMCVWKINLKPSRKQQFGYFLFAHICGSSGLFFQGPCQWARGP